MSVCTDLVFSLKKACFVFFFLQGANSYGQLGQGHAQDQAEPQCVDYGEQSQKSRYITGGGGHSALLTGETHLLLIV